MSAVDPGIERSGISLRRVLPVRYVPVLVTLALVVAMFAFGSCRYPYFGTGQVFLNLFIDNSFLLVPVVGMTFVILTGGIDLSVGSVVALSTLLCAELVLHGWPPLAGVRRRAADRRRVRPRAGRDHPLLRDPAVHRHARRHVPRPRALLRDHRRRDLDHAPGVLRRSPSTRSGFRAGST